MHKALARLGGSYFLIFVAVVALSFTRLSLIALLATLLAWCWLSYKIFGKRFYGSFVTHFFVGFLVFCVSDALIAMAFRLADVGVPLPAVVAINGAAIIALLAYAGRAQTTGATPEVKPHWIVILACAAIIASFALPVVLRPTTANFLNYSTYGYDDAPHIQMYRANVYGKGYITEVNLDKQPDLNLEPTAVSYPQALHFQLSVFARAVFQFAQTGMDNVRLLLANYRIGVVLFHAALVVLVAETIAQAVARLRQSSQKLGLVSELGIAATVLIIYATLIYPQISFAGEAFLVTVAMLAGVLLSLIMFDRADQSRQGLVFGLACLFAVGAAFTWIISLVAAFTALALAALSQSGKTKNDVLSYVKAAFRGSLQQPKAFLGHHWQWVFIAAGLALSSLPVVVLIFNTVPGVATLNTDGGIASPDHSRYLILLLAVAAGLAALAVKKGYTDNKRILGMGLLFLSPMLPVVLIYAYQTLTAGQVSYYYTKSTYMAYIFLLALAGALAVYLLERAEKLLGTLRALFVAALLFGALAIFVSVGKGFLSYVKGNGSMAQKQLTERAGQLIDQGVRPRNIISYTGRTYEEDMIFNHITNKIDQFRPENRHIITILAQRKDYNAFYQYLADYTKRSERTYIIVSKATEQTIRQAMPADGNYEIIVLDK